MCGTNPKVKTLNPLSRKEEPFQKFSNYMKKPNSLSTGRVSKEAHICEGIYLFAAKVGNSFGFKYKLKQFLISHLELKRRVVVNL